MKQVMVIVSSRDDDDSAWGYTDGSSGDEPSPGTREDTTAMRVAISILLAVSALLPAAQAAEPVRHIGIYVQPYYESAADRNGRPRVAVGKAFDEKLASNRREDVASVRDAIRAQPQMVTPMTLMVLAIRLYDVGLRDDAVFWFYAAKDRYVTVAEVLEVRSPSLAQVEEASGRSPRSRARSSTATPSATSPGSGRSARGRSSGSSRTLTRRFSWTGSPRNRETASRT
jgi:hypothetical protein